jgi:hypothetical protein
MMNPYLTDLSIAELDAAVIKVAKAHQLTDPSKGGAGEVARFAARCGESKEFLEWAAAAANFAAINNADGQHPETILMAVLSAFCIGMEIGVEVMTAAQQKVTH